MDDRDLEEWQDNVYVHHHVVCASCGQRVVPRGPSPLWRYALPVIDVLFVLLLVATAVSGMWMLAVLPATVALGIGAVAGHVYVRQPRTCPSCGEELADNRLHGGQKLAPR